MNKKQSTILVSALMCVTLSLQSKSQTLTEILQNYCVPNSCSNNKATYTNGRCECGACGLYYDKSTRTCKECPAGTYVDDRYSTECKKPDCGVGSYGVVEVGTTDCGVGYYKVSLSSCK